MQKDILYYDGNCELCNYEIDHLRSRSDGELVLQDIHTLRQDPTLPPRKLLLQRLHLRQGEGAMLVGLDANIAAWQHTRIGGIWRLLRLPVVYSIASHIYNRWAQWRFERRYEENHPVMPNHYAFKSSE